ncbi:protein of unknown function (plasmid) [Thermococcus nautili]|uniref:hypothetical protein n=1 Tax=Thermococcus nautili TaxID=195522 RepID=UPI002553DA83|nr:hypothetical protein [Thermococcus nautili]CAI1494134.1 protein of unknown function [Thermococcus nautili]
MGTETAHREFPIYHVEDSNTLNDPVYNFKGFSITIKGIFALLGALLVINLGLKAKSPAIGNFPLPLLPAIGIAVLLMVIAFYPPKSAYIEIIIAKAIHLKLANLSSKEEEETAQKGKSKKKKIIYIRKKTETGLKTSKVDTKVYNRAVFVSKQVKKL